MNSFMRVLTLFLFSLNSLAETTCVSDAQDYELLRKKLPVLFQELPVKLGGDSPGLFYDIFATIKIDLQAQTIVLYTDSWQGPRGHYKDMAEVKSVCFDSQTKNMTISFKNNAKDFVGKFSNSNIILPQITLKKITNSEEKLILEKINKKTIPPSRPANKEGAD